MSFDMLMARLRDETSRIPNSEEMNGLCSQINMNNYRMALQNVFVERKEMIREQIDPTMFFPQSCGYRMNDILSSNLECPDLQLTEEEKKDDEIVELEATYCNKMKQLKQKMQKNLGLVDEKCQKHKRRMEDTLKEQMKYRPIDHLDFNRASETVNYTYDRVRNETMEVATNSILVMMNHINETRKRRRNFSKEATEILQQFFETSKYPTENQKEMLATECNITIQQVSNWFGNKRIREKRLSKLEPQEGVATHEGRAVNANIKQYGRPNVDGFDEVTKCFNGSVPAFRLPALSVLWSASHTDSL